MKIIHYPRVSSKKQAEEGDSVEAQEKRLNKHSNENNDEVVGVYTDAGKSASISDDKIQIWHKNGFIYAKINIKKREGMNLILDKLKEDSWDGLKITKWDRFSRNNIFSKLMQIYFKNFNKAIIPIDDSTDPLMVEIKGALSEEEIRKMKERVRQTRLLRFGKGMFPARSPYGYKFSKTKKEFVVHEREAEIVKKCFEMIVEGKSYREICKELKLAPQQVYNIIRNKAYVGFVEFEGEIKKGIHSPIINDETFKNANKRLNKRIS